jgi:PucR C-terminal helix-turn-helix domain/GGDEF-like domain
VTVDRVQEITEALGSRLRRGVAVDDQTLRLLAVGKDYGDADPARIWSLLHRRTRPEDVNYARLRLLEEPSRVPPVDELGLSGRLVAPIRHRGILLGFLWIIDHDDALTPTERDDVTETAAALASLLHQRLAVQDRDRALASHLFDVLLDAGPAEQAEAAVELLAHGLIEDDSHVGVLVLRREHDPGVDGTELRTAVQDVCRRLPPGTWLSSVQRLQATVMIVGRRPVADKLCAAAGSALAALGGGPWRAGTGSPTQGLASAPAARRQAMVACQVAEALGRRSEVVAFDELGPYALLGQLPADLVHNDLLPVGLFNLLHLGAPHELLDTVESFLDNAGDKQRTAHALNVHRSTLYHRLERIEAISGLDLSDGRDRLLVHLAVKLHRLLPGLVSRSDG